MTEKERDVYMTEKNRKPDLKGRITLSRKPDLKGWMTPKEHSV